MDKNFKFYKNKTVIITGHTGFKGSWLTLWLTTLGANVVGISLKNKENNNHFDSLKIDKKVKSFYFDIQNFKKLNTIFKKYKPDFVFHLAAQSLVKKSYQRPQQTFLTNSIGTMNILESLKELKNKCNAVLITSDKVYKNFEIKRGYKESDIIGGKDPYSASKGCAELIIESYIHSFLRKNKNLKIAIARAGNVIGGGDWSLNRLIPDCARSWKKKDSVILRNPKSIRPWQNVLDVIRGYMILSLALNKNKKLNGQSFNFGPHAAENYSVFDVIKLLKKNWVNFNWKIKRSDKNFKEANLLKLNSQKAKKLLKWKSIMKFDQSVKSTAEWYKNFYKKKVVKQISLNTLEKFNRLVEKKNFF